jgi:hypothetical protein
MFAARRAGIFTLLYYTYFIVVKRALEVFACTQEEGGFYRYGGAAVLAWWRWSRMPDACSHVN